MAEDDFLIPVRKGDIVVGVPLPFRVFNHERHLLLNHGYVVESEHQLDILTEQGLFREQDRSNMNAPIHQKTTGPSETGFLETSEPGSNDADILKLMPGDSVQLQSLSDGPEERWSVRVIGHVKGKSLLVTAPIVDGRLVFIKDGQPFMIRVFSGLNVCTFQSMVLKSQLQPFSYLHFAWPNTVKTLHIRKTMRAEVDIIAVVRDNLNGEQLAAGKIQDISIGGAKFATHADFAGIGQSLMLSFKFKLEDIEEYVTLPAIVHTVRRDPGEDGKVLVTYGLQFGKLNPASRLIITNLVYQYLFKDRA